MSNEFYWRDKAFASLSEMTQSLAGEPWLAGFVEFCRLRERGLRPQAMAALKQFIEEAMGQPLGNRASFVDRIMRAPDNYMLKPEPLKRGLFVPTLKEWAQAQPGEAAPRRWLGVLTGDISLLREAVHVDPEEQISSGAHFLDRTVNCVTMSVHELPHGYGYLGDPSEDMAALDEAERLLEGVDDPDTRSRYHEKLRLLREIVVSYQEYASCVRKESFAAWARAKAGGPKTDESAPGS